jgi:hypothetical protein
LSYSIFRAVPGIARWKEDFKCKEYVPPPARPYERLDYLDDEKVWREPYKTNLLSLKSALADEELLGHAVYDYCRVLDTLPRGRWRARSLEEVLVGSPIQNVSRVDRTTSAGPPFIGPKSDLIHVDHNDFEDGGQEVSYEMNGEFHRQMVMYQSLLYKGPVEILGKATLKDEPLTVEKRRIRKMRWFNNLNGPFNLVGKRFMEPVYQLLGHYPEELEAWVNMDWSGPHVELYRKYVFSMTRLLCGDMEFFDKIIPVMFLRAAAIVFRDLYRKATDNKDPVGPQILYHWVLSHCVTLTNVDGTWCYIYGSNPSGSSATIAVNCIVLSLLFRMILFAIGGKVFNFRQYFGLSVTGDDSELAIRFEEDSEWFRKITDSVNITRCMKDFGWNYCSATDKTKAPEWVSPKDVSHCSRSFVYCPYFNQTVMALDKGRLFKMLTIMRRSPHVAEYEVCSQTYSSFLFECWLWGPETFERALSIGRETESLTFRLYWLNGWNLLPPDRSTYETFGEYVAVLYDGRGAQRFWGRTLTSD